MTQTPKSLLKLLAILLASVAVVAALVFAWMTLAPRRVPDGQPALSTLRPGSLAAFRNAFNEAEGEVRVLALLSPT